MEIRLFIAVEIMVPQIRVSSGPVSARTYSGVSVQQRSATTASTVTAEIGYGKESINTAQPSGVAQPQLALVGSMFVNGNHTVKQHCGVTFSQLEPTLNFTFTKIKVLIMFL